MATSWGLLPAAAALLVSCGDGGEGGTNPSPIQGTPSPSPSPSPVPSPAPSPAPPSAATDPIIYRATASQTFAAEGRYPRTDGGITVAFDAATGHYLVTTPASTTPRPLQRDPAHTPLGGQPWQNFVLDGFFVLVRASGEINDPAFRYLYSNLAVWGDPRNRNISGTTAFGIPTPPGGLSLQGSVTYSGFLEGTSNERYTHEGEQFYGTLQGQVSLTFDFGTGMATMVAEPTLGLETSHALPSVTLSPLVWSPGGVEFHQPVPGDPQSRAYPLSGRFTGPAGEELIGGLQLEYISPTDGSRQLAGVAFIAARAPWDY